MDWHFSGTWKHLFQNVPRYKDSWNTEWATSAQLLERSVALPILVSSTEQEMTDLAYKILELLNDL